MTLSEFFGSYLIAFGPAFALFVITIAPDPIRVIILLASAFMWLLSLEASALLWIAVVPLRQYLEFSVIFSVIFQEAMRYTLFMLIRRAENFVQRFLRIAITENKHILSYVAGLAFGIASGLFTVINLFADMSGPGTIGLKGGSEIFYVVTSFQTLSIILLHTFWSVIFFNAFDTSNYIHIAFVVISHLVVSLITLLNSYEMYALTLILNYSITILTGILAYKTAGGNKHSFKRFITCQ